MTLKLTRSKITLLKSWECHFCTQMSICTAPDLFKLFALNPTITRNRKKCDAADLLRARRRSQHHKIPRKASVLSSPVYFFNYRRPVGPLFFDLNGLTVSKKSRSLFGCWLKAKWKTQFELLSFSFIRPHHHHHNHQWRDDKSDRKGTNCLWYRCQWRQLHGDKSKLIKR